MFTIRCQLSLDTKGIFKSGRQESSHHHCTKQTKFLSSATAVFKRCASDFSVVGWKEVSKVNDPSYAYMHNGCMVLAAIVL